MTLSQVYEMFNHWRRVPPLPEMLAMLARVFTTWEPDLSAEEKLESGAMDASDFFARFQRTGGKVEGMGPPR